MSEPKGRGPAWPLGTVTVLGAHILDVLGRPVEEIPPGQGSVRLKEIRATAAGTAAGTGVDLAKLGARVRAVGALGGDLLGDIVIAAMARHGVDTAGLIRKKQAQTSATILPIRPNGERPAFHVPGATRLFTRADIDLDADPGQPGPAHRRPGRARRADRRGPGGHRRGGQEPRRARRRRRAAPRPAGGPRQARPAAGRDGLVPAERRPASRPHRPPRPRPGHQGHRRARHHRRGRDLRRPGRDRPGLGRPASRTWARCSAFWSVRSRPWPAGSRPDQGRIKIKASSKEQIS